MDRGMAGAGGSGYIFHKTAPQAHGKEGVTILKQFSRWEQQFTALYRELKQAVDMRDGDGAAEVIRDLSKAVETMCHNLREEIVREYDSVLTSGNISGEPLLLPEAPHVEVSIQDDVLTIYADAILPFATKGPSYYILGELEAALNRLLKEQNLIVPIFTEPSAVLFLHHYNRQGRRYVRRQLRDFDNVEHRAVLNTLSRYCVWDDGPGNIVLMDALVLDREDFTEILVMPIHRFVEYLMSEKRPFLFQNTDRISLKNQQE